ncbi:MAG: hypothetical protein BYD32DRAFT_451261 [Podila humilis]|nr:MAG: hypothetical protein BYD32DRAFT_451261 [Podila humilis]
MATQRHILPVPPFILEELDGQRKPRVLISGGGIGGLTLALLLLRGNIPFLVFEKSRELKPLGSAMAMGPSVTALFKQLGIWDEFVERSKVLHTMRMYKEDLKLVNTMTVPWLEEAAGCLNSIISRPQLYDLLFRSIPRDRILLGKRVLSFTQNQTNVIIECSDSSSYYGDILIGADGAYSAVRQQLFKELKANHKLPPSDDVTLPFGCVCLVGQTVPLDPEEFPHLKEERAQVNSVLGKSTMCTWVTVTTAQNTVCWMVIHFLDKHSAKRHDSFRNSEWGLEEAEALSREVRQFLVPGGKDGKVRTLGEYVERTPRDLMSKVMLEEIVFDTWYGGRTVLLGDACHKMNPSGGLAGIHAIHDAVTLANWLSTLRSAGQKEVEKVFKEYRTERYPVAKVAFETSQMFTHNFGKNLLSAYIRALMKRLPMWLWKKIICRMYSTRPQCSFLPLVADNASIKPSYQRSLRKTLKIHREQANIHQ